MIDPCAEGWCLEHEFCEAKYDRDTNYFLSATFMDIIPGETKVNFLVSNYVFNVVCRHYICSDAETAKTHPDVLFVRLIPEGTEVEFIRTRELEDLEHVCVREGAASQITNVPERASSNYSGSSSSSKGSA